MVITKLSSKGQIHIPKFIRSAHHWLPGTEFVIEDTGDGVVLKPRKPFPPTCLENGLGCTGYQGPAKTVEEMEEGIAVELRRSGTGQKSNDYTGYQHFSALCHQ